MAVRDILLYPERRAALCKKSEPVRKLNRSIRKLIDDLKDTLIAHPEGIGLAAPQVNDHRRVVIVRLGAKSEEDGEAGPPIALINPVIAEAQDERQDFDGCLSFPGLYGQTIRPHYLRVTGLDETGKPFDRVFVGFDAVVAHHEIDHLDGVLFIDRIRRLEDLYRVRLDEAGQLVRMPASPTRLTKAIFDAGGNIVALGTFLGESTEDREVMLKVDGVSAQVLREAIEPVVKRAVDVREAPAT